MLRLPLFVFGTLRRDECNHHYYLAGAFDRMRPAKLLGFHRVEPLMIVREQNSIVEGELYDLTLSTYARTLQGCDELEDLPFGKLIGNEYRRIPVRVQTEDENVIAWAYVRPDAEPDADLLSLIDAECESQNDSDS